MKRKIRTLLICITLSVLFGCLSKAALFTPEAVETSFGTLAETVYFYEDIHNQEETSVSEHEIISEIIEGDALRHFPQTKRVNSSSSSKDGLTFMKRNYTPYSSPLIFESYKRFPSGLTEAKQYLISLGKLII